MRPKQRHTARRIFERLRDEDGYTGCYEHPGLPGRHSGPAVSRVAAALFSTAGQGSL
jgi:hypothetical protein